MSKKSIQNIAWAFLYALWTATVFIAVSAVFVLLLTQVGGDALYTWLTTPFGTFVLAASVYVLSTFFALLPLLVRKKAWKKIAQKLTLLEPFRAKMIPWALSTWILYALSSAVVVAVLYFVNIPGLDLQQKQDVGFSQLHGVFEYVAAFVLLVGIAPFFEELLFRGYLFGRIRGKNGFWFSAVLTSLTFAFMHGQLNVAIDVFVLSMFLCYLREHFQAIWPGILVHAFKNSMAYVLLFILPLFGVQLV